MSARGRAGRRRRARGGRALVPVAGPAVVRRRRARPGPAAARPRPADPDRPARGAGRRRGRRRVGLPAAPALGRPRGLGHRDRPAAVRVVVATAAVRAGAHLGAAPHPLPARPADPARHAGAAAAAALPRRHVRQHRGLAGRVVAAGRRAVADGAAVRRARGAVPRRPAARGGRPRRLRGRRRGRRPRAAPGLPRHPGGGRVRRSARRPDGGPAGRPRGAPHPAAAAQPDARAARRAGHAGAAARVRGVRLLHPVRGGGDPARDRRVLAGSRRRPAGRSAPSWCRCRSSWPRSPGLYFTVYAITDETYRRQFFTEITTELEHAVGVRAVYEALR